MKKICIISAVNIRHMTLISLYTDKLKESSVEYDIIYMDKHLDSEEKFDAKNKFIFKNKIKQNESKIRKIYKYYKFREYAISTLKNKEYDFLIIWNDVAIFLFADYLYKYWRGKYCLNIRDYFFENKFKWIKNRFKKVIDYSSFTTISSNGFKIFLPEHEYVQIHSLNTSVLTNANIHTKQIDAKKPIKITFIGYVRFYEINKSILDVFKNDYRFELHYYGTNASILEEYASNNQIQNAKFFDTFPVEQTSKFLEKSDLINNIYGDDKIDLKYAVSIKLYHGIYCRIPILVNAGTWGEMLIKKYGIGFVIEDISYQMKEDLYNWYRNLDYCKFNEGCEKFLIDIKTDNERLNALIREYLL